MGADLLAAWIRPRSARAELLQGPVHLDADDAAELVEVLAFLGGWLDDTGTADFAGSLRRFTGGGYGLADL